MAAAQPSTPFRIPAQLVEFILLGPEDDRRQLQDSPILGDVWLQYASEPAVIQDLLVTPHRDATAPRVAKEIYKRLQRGQRDNGRGRAASLAYLQGIVAVRLYFDEVLRVLVPLTDWWEKRRIAQTFRAEFPTAVPVVSRLEALIRFARQSLRKERPPSSAETRFSALERYLTLAGLILWAGERQREGTASASEVLELALDDSRWISERVWQAVEAAEKPGEARIFQVSRNRRATPALEHSVPAVKADAARTLFNVSCDKIAWAVLDSGIDAAHEAFRDKDGASRVIATYDFSLIRDIVSIDNSDLDDARVKELARNAGLSEETVREWLDKLATDASNERPVDWNLVEKLIESRHPETPSSIHGTHVAGILGAKMPEGRSSDCADGMCRDIRLYDFRVLSKSMEETEFAIIGALQYIRYTNQQHSYVRIHGANLSLSIPHNVRNYACGYTPICTECERLVESGVTVVAAAGNRGYQSFQVEDGVYESYAAFSITDPGNADGVITVGATHPRAPHSYGVSFFSSRGPTGDGRLKPDLVAPGERILAPIASSSGNAEWGEESGTSMAAPHVSGAAAMLMARYSELVGQPRRIKKILCESATDLGRERSFQGHGMLDVLRAFQSI